MQGDQCHTNTNPQQILQDKKKHHFKCIHSVMLGHNNTMLKVVEYLQFEELSNEEDVSQ